MPISGKLLALPIHAEDRLIVAVLALLLDALVGDLPALFAHIPHPVVLVGRAIALFDRRLNRDTRSASTRRARGVAVAAFLSLTAAALGLALSAGAAAVPAGWLIELLLVTLLVAQRSLYQHVAAVAAALDRYGLGAARDAVSRIVGRDPESLDRHGVARAAIESLAENFSDGVVAPVFFYVLGGLPALFVYKAVNTLDSMIGHRTPRHRAFGWAAARLDDLLNLVPARLSGVLIAAAACFVPRGRPGRALGTMWRDAAKHSSPNAGWPEAAVAGALDLALAGPRRYASLMVNDPWLGNGRARATSDDIRRALMLFVVGCLIEALLLGVLALAGAA